MNQITMMVFTHLEPDILEQRQGPLGRPPHTQREK